MGKRKKLWTSMSVVTFASVSVLTACGTQRGEEGEGDRQSAVIEESSASQLMLYAKQGRG